MGDSEIDAEAAARAEVPFLLYTEGYRKAPIDQLTSAAVFSDYVELPGVVAAL